MMELMVLFILSDLSWTESGDLAVRNYKKGDELKTILFQQIQIEKEYLLGVKQLTVNKFQEYATDESERVHSSKR